MAKISISQVLHIRSRVRILTVMATIVVAAFLFQMTIAQNPKSVQAAASCTGSTIITCTISESGILMQGSTDQFFSGPSNPRLTIPITANLVITGAGVVVTFWDSLSFANLTIQNGATVTHEAVTAAEATVNIGGTPTIADDGTSGTGARKRVDVTLSGDLTLQGAGNIDVSGKGYPGSPMDRWSLTPHNHRAYGPQPGVDAHCWQNCFAYGSGGGGYAAGGAGLSPDPPNPGDPAVSPGPAGNTNYDLFDFGSGGGGAKGGGSDDRSDPMADGGTGGGRVKIVANNVFYRDINSFIHADGLRGELDVANSRTGDASGGGGAGGSINIKVSGSVQYSALNGWTGLLTRDGDNTGTGNWRLIGFTSPSDLYNMSANGGGSGNSNITYGNAGGGRIKIEQPVGISVKKTLKAYLRSDSGSPDICPSNPDPNNSNCFNPYALKIGDTIVVNLQLENIIIGQAFTLTDESLDNHTSPRHFCQYVPYSKDATCDDHLPNSDPTGPSGISITPDSTSCLFRYRCQVK